MWLEWNDKLINLDLVRQIYISGRYEVSADSKLKTISKKYYLTFTCETETIDHGFETQKDAIKEYERIKEILLPSYAVFRRYAC